MKFEFEKVYLLYRVKEDGFDGYAYDPNGGFILPNGCFYDLTDNDMVEFAHREDRGLECVKECDLETFKEKKLCDVITWDELDERLGDA